jgi:hypothetical protein
VTGLPGVIATGKTLEACRDQLVEVIEEWLLVRVSQGLRIPRLSTGLRAGLTSRSAPSLSAPRTRIENQCQ